MTLSIYRHRSAEESEQEDDEFARRLYSGLDGEAVLQRLHKLCRGDLETMKRYVVADDDVPDLRWSGAQFWEYYRGKDTTERTAAFAVVLAWNAGTTRAAGVRQAELHSWWPALADALNRLTEEQVGDDGL